VLPDGDLLGQALAGRCTSGERRAYLRSGPRLTAVALLHGPGLIGKIIGRPLPGDADPLRRVRGYKKVPRMLNRRGKNCFRKASRRSSSAAITASPGCSRFICRRPGPRCAPKPLVYSITSAQPDNQFYFWPEYRYAGHRKGENAIYVTEPGTASLERGWFWKWLTGKEVLVAREPTPVFAPPLFLQQFESATNLGVQEIKVDGRIMKRIQLFECRNLR